VLARIAVIVLVLSACGGDAEGTRHVASMLTATCTDDGIEVDQTAVDAQPHCVHQYVQKDTEPRVLLQVGNRGHQQTPHLTDTIE
jgi:hypothetical protein